MRGLGRLDFHNIRVHWCYVFSKVVSTEKKLIVKLLSDLFLLSKELGNSCKVVNLNAIPLFTRHIIRSDRECLNMFAVTLIND